MISFFSSWYFVVIILGTLFIYLTRSAWNEVIKRAAIEIKNRFITFKSANQEQQKVSKIEDKWVSEHKKFRKLLKTLNVKNFNEFNKLLENAVQESLSDKNKLQELGTRLDTTVSFWKFYMFSYLNIYLVPNSKITLLWLYNNSNSTKDLLTLNIYLPPQIPTPDLEKEAIFNALLSNFLLVKDNRDLYMVSDLGIEFLTFIELVKLS